MCHVRHIVMAADWVCVHKSHPVGVDCRRNLPRTLHIFFLCSRVRNCTQRRCPVPSSRCEQNYCPDWSMDMGTVGMRCLDLDRRMSRHDMALHLAHTVPTKRQSAGERIRAHSSRTTSPSSHSDSDTVQPAMLSRGRNRYLQPNPSQPPEFPLHAAPDRCTVI